MSYNRKAGVQGAPVIFQVCWQRRRRCWQTET